MLSRKVYLVLPKIKTVLIYRHNVAFVGLQLGTVKTEQTMQMIEKKGDDARLPLDPNSLLLKVNF